MNKVKFNELLNKLNACNDAKEWTKNKSLKQAWNKSDRGDWMLWLCKKANLDLRKLTLAKAKCAMLVIHLMKDQRSIDAVHAAEQFGNGEISREQLDAAAAAAAAAYAAAYAAAAADAAAYAAAYAYAAYAAAYAAAAADAAAYAAAYAAAAADAAAYAAYADAYADADAAAYAAADACKDMLNKCAIEIRKIVSIEDILNCIKD
jgi:hypothetical protein